MSKKAPLACLFDLDGTILNSRKCGSRSFELAMKELYGWENPLEGVLVAGMTDRRIFFGVYKKFRGKVPDGPAWDAQVETFKQRYLYHLRSLMNEKPPLLYPGFPALFDPVSSVAGMEPGIATGNFREGAELKLAAARIDPGRFSFGSFGCETEDRPTLLKLAEERARVLAGGEVRAVVIGDTPEDYRAARYIGVPCALVSTGPYAHEELESLRPDFITKDFNDPSGFLGWLSSLRR